MEDEKCLVQVYEILNHLEDDEIEKIPEHVINSIFERKDKNYIWLYDETKPLNEQVLDRKTIAMLSYINIEYLLDEAQKTYIKKIHESNTEKLFPKIGVFDFTNTINHGLKEQKLR